LAIEEGNRLAGSCRGGNGLLRSPSDRGRLSEGRLKFAGGGGSVHNGVSEHLGVLFALLSAAGKRTTRLGSCFFLSIRLLSAQSQTFGELETAGGLKILLSFLQMRAGMVNSWMVSALGGALIEFVVAVVNFFLFSEPALLLGAVQVDVAVTASSRSLVLVQSELKVDSGGGESHFVLLLVFSVLVVPLLQFFLFFSSCLFFGVEVFHDVVGDLFAVIFPAALLSNRFGLVGNDGSIEVDDCSLDGALLMKSLELKTVNVKVLEELSDACLATLSDRQFTFGIVKRLFGDTFSALLGFNVNFAFRVLEAADESQCVSEIGLVHAFVFLAIENLPQALEQFEVLGVCLELGWQESESSKDTASLLVGDRLLLIPLFLVVGHVSNHVVVLTLEFTGGVLLTLRVPSQFVSFT